MQTPTAQVHCQTPWCGRRPQSQAKQKPRWCTIDLAQLAAPEDGRDGSLPASSQTWETPLSAEMQPYCPPLGSVISHSVSPLGAIISCSAIPLGSVISRSYTHTHTHTHTHLALPSHALSSPLGSVVSCEQVLKGQKETGEDMTSLRTPFGY